MAEQIVTAGNNGGPAEENKPETPKDAAPWLKMIENAEKVFDGYHTMCDVLAKDYADGKTLGAASGAREFQMFYANLEVMKPSIYARPPQPVVVPRFKDSKKPVHRKTSEILERALVSSFDTEKVHQTLLKVRDDLALYGRGAVWNRYEAYQKEDKLKECVHYEWLYRRDFLHEPSRCWAEVGWVARGTWLTKEQGEKRFIERDEQGQPMLYPDGTPVTRWKEIVYTDKSDAAEEYKVEKKARVWELWHKGENKVVWLHPHSKEVLEIADPHLNLEGFFPCPQPAYGTCEPGTLVPVPDACFYKDQLEEINELTARISSLSESLRLMGFYPAGSEDLGAAIEAAMAEANKGENRRILLPLSGFSAFGGATALKDAIVWLPLEQVAATIVQLIQLRKTLIDDVYQISGISDIMRGQTEASETLGAQQLKSQYGSIRIKDRQGEMVRIADGALNISGEIMAENFSPETLLSMSQVDDLPKQADIIAQHQQAVQQQIAALAQQAQQPPQEGQPPPDPAQMQAQFEQAKEAIVLKAKAEIDQVVTVEKVFTLLRAEKLRPFALQIATDSTIQPDENAEKQARNEFAAAFAQVARAMAPILQADPSSAAFCGAMMKFILAPYRAGREMEQAVDEWIEGMVEKSKKPQPPSPEQIKAEGEAKAREQDMAAKAAEMQDRQADRAEKAAQSQRDAARQAMEDQRKAQQAERDAMLADAEARAKAAEIERKAAADVQKYEHEQAMLAGQLRLQELQIELAEVKLQQAREKPAPMSNGNGAEYGDR